MPNGYDPECKLCQGEINDNIRDAIKRNNKHQVQLWLEIADKAGIKVWTYIPESFTVQGVSN